MEHRRKFLQADYELQNLILATHAPDDGQKFDLKPLLNIVEKLFQDDSTFGIEGFVHATSDAQIDIVNTISMQLSRNLSVNEVKIDHHSQTMDLFRTTLSSYSWDAKAVFALAAYGVNYGEFWIASQLLPTNFMEQNMVILRQGFDYMKKYINTMVKLTKCIVELKELFDQYINNETPSMAMAMVLLQIAVYWIVRCVTVCSLKLIHLIGYENMSSTAEGMDQFDKFYIDWTGASIQWEFASFTYKLNTLHDQLTKQLALCYQEIGKVQS